MTDEVEKYVKCNECGFQVTEVGPLFQVHEKIRIHKNQHDDIEVMPK